jgi:hypothetical protein
MTTQPATRPSVFTPAEQAELDEWIEEQLAKPGGHGPLPREAERVLSALFANRPRPGATRRT